MSTKGTDIPDVGNKSGRIYRHLEMDEERSISGSGEFELSDAGAKALYEQFDGLDFSDRRLPVDLERGVSGVLEKIDQIKSQLVYFTYHLSLYFDKADYYSDSGLENNTFEELIQIRNDLMRWPGHDGTLEIYYRGIPDQQDTQTDDRSDYVVRFGNITIDTIEIDALIERVNVSMRYLPHLLSDAFNIFSKKGIGSVVVNIRWLSEAQMHHFRACLRTLSYFNSQMKPVYDSDRTPTDTMFRVQYVKKENAQGPPMPLFYNESDCPDLNLTLLAIVNDIEPEKFQSILKKIHGLMKKADRDAKRQYLSVYDALLHTKNLPFEIIAPPVEVNSIHLMISEPDRKMVPREKAIVVKLIVENQQKDLLEASRALQSIYGSKSVYGNEFEVRSPAQTRKRLEYALRVIEDHSNHKAAEQIEKEVCQNVGSRLSDVRDEVLETLSIPDEVMKIRHERKHLIRGTEIFSGSEHVRFRKMIHYFKKRSMARKKIRNLFRGQVQFDDTDYAVIAKDFMLPVEQVKRIVSLIKSCFDAQNHFVKNTFVKLIPEFAEYGDKIFGFLWHYLKSLDLPRKNRVSYLNALQMLVARMTRRDRAIMTLMSDVFRDPAVIQFSDRNAMMLSNIIIRKYNKESNIDIELTPEEVLLIDQGLLFKLVDKAAFTIDDYQEAFLVKILSIQEEIRRALVYHETDRMPIKFVLNLEKEIYTFFSLVKGVTACAVLRIAMAEYGSSASEIYRLPKSRLYLPTLLQRLRVIIRGLGRIGELEDLYLLYEVKSREKEFIALGENLAGIMSRIIQIADESIDRIKTRAMASGKKPGT